MEIELKDAARAEDVLAFTDAIVSGEPNLNANLANLAALLNQYVPRINWVGFYIHETSSGDWVLGPFAGKPACTRIAPAQGVVGRALQNGQTLVVDDVRAFPGHIACDDASRSEVVVPIVADGHVVAGLDVDSPELGRFSRQDVHLFEEVCQRVAASWTRGHWY